MAKNYIKAAASKYGVPYWIAHDIALEESGGNPNAVGDNGQSFGLFQLNVNGQGKGYTKAQLLDPQTNADIGVKNLAKAYKKSESVSLSGFNLLESTANNSGHPGYLGVSKTQTVEPNYDANLLRVYQQQSGTRGKAENVTSSNAGIPATVHSSTLNWVLVGGAGILILAALV